MSWEPISLEDLLEQINRSWDRMSLPQRRFWEAIRIDPVKWQSHPYGDLGGGFWVVALMGTWALWYNDIEDGFNRSQFVEPGTLADYWCNQDELEWQVQEMMNIANSGYPLSGRFGPPEPVVYPEGNGEK